MLNPDEIKRQFQRDTKGTKPRGLPAGELRTNLERVMRNYAARIDAEVEADRVFFLQHPDRRYRVRLPFPTEGQMFRETSILDPLQPHIPPDSQLVVLVHQVAPGWRNKKVIFLKGQAKAKVIGLLQSTDEEARRLYDGWGPSTRGIS